MSLATRQCGTFLPMLKVCSALLFGAAASAFAQPVLPVAPGQIHVRFEGMTGDPRTGSLDVKLLKIHPLANSPGRLLEDGSACPEAGKLFAGGLTLVCRPDATLHEWYQKVLAGTTDRKSGSVIYLDRSGSGVLRTYNLFDCFPTNMRRHEPEDCDDADAELMEVEFSVGAVEIIARKGQHNGDYLPAYRFKLEIDNCPAGTTCPDTVTDGVSGAEISLDAACLATGEPRGSLQKASAFSVLIGRDDDCDGLCDLVLQSQVKPVPPANVTAIINTSRSNIKHRTAAGPPPAVIQLEGARIRSVTFPTFQVVPTPPPTESMAIEKIEIAVEKVERA